MNPKDVAASQSHYRFVVVPMAADSTERKSVRVLLDTAPLVRHLKPIPARGEQA